jgi:putative oxidoreductase
MPVDVEEKGMEWVRRIGQLSLSIIFIAGGWDAARSPGARPAKVAALGLTQPELLVRANGVVMVVAGSVLALGRWPRSAAAVLVSSLVPTSVVGHPFWQETTPSGRVAQQVHFLKNLGLFGGLLLVLAEDHST